MTRSEFRRKVKESRLSIVANDEGIKVTADVTKEVTVDSSAAKDADGNAVAGAEVSAKDDQSVSKEAQDNDSK